MLSRESWWRMGTIESVFVSRTRVRAYVWDKCGGKCHYCGTALNPFRNFQIDHAIPLSAGGTDDLGNLVGSCRECNRSKSHNEDKRLKAEAMHRGTTYCRECHRVVPTGYVTERPDTV